MALISTLKGGTLKGRTLILAAPHTAYTGSGLEPAVLPITAYTAPGGSSVKSVNGLLSASIKTIQGLVIASVKTVQGLA